MVRILCKQAIILTWLISACHVANAMPPKPVEGALLFEARHGPQGTGNYKGKRDRHEKPGPQHERKKKTGKWKSSRR